MFIEESNLFFDWYLNTEKVTKNSFKEFNYVFLPLLEKFADLPQVLVHRDYHIDNLFYLAKRKNFLRCGLIDYQDAVIGPCVYDLVSLTQDARIDIPKQLESHLIKYYLKKNNFIDKELFRYCYNIIAIQRHLKVLGIFSRLSIREIIIKQYLNHLPRVKFAFYKFTTKIILKSSLQYFHLLKMTKINEAMIFAAGLGKRMLPLSEKIPKPLLSIKNKPIIFYIIEELIALNLRISL